jgi:hypothetical protein
MKKQRKQQGLEVRLGHVERLVRTRPWWTRIGDKDGHYHFRSYIPHKGEGFIENIERITLEIWEDPYNGYGINLEGYSIFPLFQISCQGGNEEGNKVKELYNAVKDKYFADQKGMKRRDLEVLSEYHIIRRIGGLGKRSGEVEK